MCYTQSIISFIYIITNETHRLTTDKNKCWSINSSKLNKDYSPDSRNQKCINLQAVSKICQSTAVYSYNKLFSQFGYYGAYNYIIVRLFRTGKYSFRLEKINKKIIIHYSLLYTHKNFVENITSKFITYQSINILVKI